MRRFLSHVCLLLVLVLLATACSTGGIYLVVEPEEPGPEVVIGPQTDPEVVANPEPMPAPEIVPDAAVIVGLPEGTPQVDDCQGDAAMSSLTSAGALLWADRVAPTYTVVAKLNDAGEMSGMVEVVLPPQPNGVVSFRAFPLAHSQNDFVLTSGSVDGQPIEIFQEGSLIWLVVPVNAQSTVQLGFSYTMPSSPETGIMDMSGNALDPEDIGLLAAGPSVVTLGHWFPLLVAPGANTTPNLEGPGDISNFPSAHMCAELTVPAGWTAVGGGLTLNQVDEDGAVRVVEAAVGVRDLAMVLMRDVEYASATVAGVQVQVWGQPGDPVDEVLRETTDSIVALNDAFGPYPWTQLDVVNTPLGSGVGGMEWPGMIWIESTTFRGGIPGLGDVGAIFGDNSELADGPLGELFEDDMLGTLFGDMPGMAGLATLREWTVAHEVGHMWWHALVGNDSTLNPALDEPLAQYASCVVMEAVYGAAQAEPICMAHTAENYEATKMVGGTDAAADQATDAFDNSFQYGGVVYGKAPVFYLELRDILGTQGVNDALAGFVQEYGFDQTNTVALQEWLVNAAGDQGEEVKELWNHWFNETHGDADLL